MIKKLFIPEEIGTYFVIPQKILSIEITKTTIQAALVKAQGKKRIILKLIKKDIDTSHYNSSVINSLKEIKSEVKYDKIYTLFYSSQIIFKDLTLPIVGSKKIKLIVPFEIESQLPFSLDKAVIDNVIIAETKQPKKTDLIVAATKESNLRDYLSLFSSAGLEVNRVGVDILELYSLYKYIMPKFSSKIQAIVEGGYDSTKVALIVDDKLQYIRVINKGLLNIAGKIPVSEQNSIADRLAYLFKVGVNKKENNNFNSNNNLHNGAAEQILTDLINEVNFSINTYIDRHPEYRRIDNIILMGSIVDIPNIEDLVSKITQTRCQPFEVNKIIQNDNISSKELKLENSFISTISNALALPNTHDFDLQQIIAKPSEEKLAYYRLVTALGLAFFTIFGFTAYSFLKIRKLSQSYNQAQAQSIQQLKKEFGLKKESELKTLENANKAAKKILNQQSSAGKLLSQENRTALLRYLIELSKCINLKETQLEVSQINIVLSNKQLDQPDRIEIFGHVENYAQLNKLQNQLACPLFKTVPKLHELNFKQTPITLEIKEEQ